MNSQLQIRLRQGFSLQGSTSESDAPNRKYEGEYIKYETKKYGSDFCVAYNVTRATGDFRDDGLEPISLVLHATSHYMREIEGQVRELLNIFSANSNEE